jgi:hypothetical protein
MVLSTPLDGTRPNQLFTLTILLGLAADPTPAGSNGRD